MAPETSIIVRTLNEEKHIVRLLEALQRQTYSDFEVVLVDSGSTDRTVDLASKFTSNIYTMPKEQFTFGRSLNIGCQQAQGKYLVSVSAHVYPLANTWLANLIRPFEDQTIGMVYGSQRVGNENSIAEERSMIYNFGDSSRIWIDQPAGHNGNSAIRQSLWLQQPFDEHLTGFEDLDWAKRIQLKGHRVFYAADARVAHIHEESIRQVYRRFFREALAFKQIFPGYRLSKLDATKYFAYCVSGDWIFALKNRKSPRKLLRIIPERTVEWVSKYKATNYHKVLTRKLRTNIVLPENAKNDVIEVLQKNSVNPAVATTPDPGPNEVLVEVGYVPVSIGDLAALNGHSKYNCQTEYRPFIPGIECSGLIVKCGSQVTQFHYGEKVLAEGAFDIRGFGADDSTTSVLTGSHVRYIKLSSQSVHKIPDDVMLREATVVKILSLCIRAIKQLSIQRSQVVCVMGAGPAGNFIAQLLAAQGTKVTVVDHQEMLLSLLWKYNVDALTSPEDLEKFDHLIDTSPIGENSPMLLKGAHPSAKILTFGPPIDMVSHTQLELGAEKNRNYVTLANIDSNDRKEAIRLVKKGIICLEDHTRLVFPLAGYQEALGIVEKGSHLSVLINASPDLASF